MNIHSHYNECTYTVFTPNVHLAHINGKVNLSHKCVALFPDEAASIFFLPFGKWKGFWAHINLTLFWSSFFQWLCGHVFHLPVLRWLMVAIVVRQRVFHDPLKVRRRHRALMVPTLVIGVVEPWRKAAIMAKKMNWGVAMNWSCCRAGWKWCHTFRPLNLFDMLSCCVVPFSECFCYSIIEDGRLQIGSHLWSPIWHDHYISFTVSFQSGRRTLIRNKLTCW